MRFPKYLVRTFLCLSGVLCLGAAGHAQDWANRALGKQESPATGEEVDLLAGVLAFFSGSSTKQSICLGSSLFHVEEFADSPAFKKSDVAKWAKSTVRLRITHTPRALSLMEPIRAQLGASDFSLAGFATLAGMDEGICTGTLIAGNVVLTAGHCLTEEHWTRQQNVEFPYFTIKGERKALTPAQFAKLLIADFDYQLNLSPVASSDELGPAPVRQLKPFAVHSLADIAMPTASSSLDFAIVRLLANTDQISEYALGANKLGTRNPSNGEPVVIVQHPGGSYKKIATGAVASDPADIPLRHTASTGAGSSGAAILTRRGELVGIHTDGGCDKDEPNAGTRLQRIRKALAAALRSKADK